MKNKEVKTPTLTGVWKKLPPSLLGDLEPSVQEGTAAAVETARELGLELEPKDRTESLRPHGKTSMDKELLLMDEQTNWFLALQSTPGEDAVKTVEMTTKELEYYTDLAD